MTKTAHSLLHAYTLWKAVTHKQITQEAYGLRLKRRSQPVTAARPASERTHLQQLGCVTDDNFQVIRVIHLRQIHMTRDMEESCSEFIYVSMLLMCMQLYIIYIYIYIYVHRANVGKSMCFTSLLCSSAALDLCTPFLQVCSASPACTASPANRAGCHP